MQSTLPKKEIVLLGIGHTNAHVLRMWRMRPLKHARLTCVSNYSVATYSGMLPGVLAGQYPLERIEIDLVRLCAANGARFIQGEVKSLDAEGRHLLFENRPPLPFDALSIGIGSVPTFDGVEDADETLLAIKPMQTFVARLDSRLREVRSREPDRRLRVAVVGGGAGGVEVTFCLPHRIQNLFGDTQLDLTLIHGGDRLVQGTLKVTSTRVKQELASRGVNVLLGERVKRACCGRIELAGGQQLEVDVAIWVTNAAAPPLLAKLNLPRDERGFLLTDDTLRTTAGAPIFAVGDTGAIETKELPKAGVYAVRQGPILWENLKRTLNGNRLIAYQPQRNFLKLLNTGDGRAMGEYPIGKKRGVTLHNRMMWKLKNAIDGSFIDKYQDYTPMEISPAGDKEEEEDARTVIRCTERGGECDATDRKRG